MEDALSIIFVHRSPAGGGAIHRELPARFLARAGLDVTLSFDHVDPDALQHVSSEGLHYESRRDTTGVGGEGKLAQIFRLFLALRGWKSRRDKLIYLYGPALVGPAWLALLGMNGSRLVYHTQDFLDPKRYPFRCQLEKAVSRKAELVICNEANRARILKSSYNLQRTPLVVPTGLPRDSPIPERTEQLREELMADAFAADRKVILHQGPFSPVRMGAELVEALGLLEEDYLLVFTGMRAGSKDTESLQSCAENHGVWDRVVCHDRVPFEALTRFAVAADIGILLYPNDGPGNYYQYPGRLTEYAACGLPAVMSDFPVFREISEKHGMGVCCDPYSAESVAEAIKTVGSVSGEAVDTRRALIRKAFLEHLAYEHGVDRLVNAVRAIAERSP